MRHKAVSITLFAVVLAASATLLLRGVFAMPNAESAHVQTPSSQKQPRPEPEGLQKATFGGGCFWCTEAVFLELKGVHSVASGYSGGSVKNPTYEQVCTGATGHAEVIQINYDPKQVNYKDLLEVFWRTHDPTTLNRQGNDVGTQYRSVVFYHNDEQKALAEEYRKKLNASGVFDKPIVTEIAPFTEFYRAEAYHQNYYANNPRQGYCVAIIGPKLEKFRKVFKDKLKTSGK
jgi:peptide-methionine (S)-S-oxide reductase